MWKVTLIHLIDHHQMTPATSAHPTKTTSQIVKLVTLLDQITVSGRPGPYQEAAFFFTDVNWLATLFSVRINGAQAMIGCNCCW